MLAVSIFFNFLHHLFKASDTISTHPSIVLLLLFLVYSVMLAMEMLDTDPTQRKIPQTVVVDHVTETPMRSSSLAESAESEPHLIWTIPPKASLLQTAPLISTWLFIPAT
jgi:hypothetical protein